MTEHDRALLTQLSRLNAASTALSMDLLQRSASREDHIKLVLLLLDVADRVLKRIVEHPGTVENGGT
ncbi:MAG: hypothetical protein LC799_24970 [Actinobacteria bacterium]|nr:hypothetical protein [Actinomycetota bacterium]